MTTHEETKGAEILSYHIRWDKKTYGLEWYDLVGLDSDYVDVDFTHASDILPGETYRFQIRCRNKWGWGEWSSILWVKASTWPTVVDQPITSIDPETGGVVISWIAPDDRSSDITQYTIELEDKNNLAVWFEDLTNCDGSDSVIIE